MRKIVVLAVVLVLGLIGAAVFRSNMFISEGHASFAPGENGLNTLSIRGPSGWYCMEYSRTKTSPLDEGLSVSGKGSSECPLFGTSDIHSNDYPDSGSVAVPLNQRTRVYQSESNNYEIYVLITQDRSAYQRLEDEE